MRYWEIDAARGIFIIGMVAYHLLVDLELFYQMPLGVFEFPLKGLAGIVGAGFIFLLGLNAYIQLDKEKGSMGLWKRAGILGLGAMAITAVTRIIYPENYIRFGILHLLSLSLVLLAVLLKIQSKKVLFWLGLAVLSAGIFVKIPSPPAWDFYPPIPWFGWALWGAVLGKIYLPWRQKKQLVKHKLNGLAWLGRRSLLIYFLHQPLLLAILKLVLG